MSGCHACRNHLGLSEVYPSQPAVSLARLTMAMATPVCRGALRALGTPDFHLGERSVSSCPSQHRSDAAALESRAYAGRLQHPANIAQSSPNVAHSEQTSGDGTARMKHCMRRSGTQPWCYCRLERPASAPDPLSPSARPPRASSGASGLSVGRRGSSNGGQSMGRQGSGSSGQPEEPGLKLDDLLGSRSRSESGAREEPGLKLEDLLATGPGMLPAA